MKKALFVFLPLLLVFANWGGAKDIEVIIGGKTYSSVDAYHDSQSGVTTAKQRKPKPPKKEEGPDAALDPLTAQAVKELGSVSSEQSVGKMTADFEQNWDNPTPKFKVDSSFLEKKLEAIADGRKEPLLIVSEKDKLRLLLLDEKSSNKN